MFDPGSVCYYSADIEISGSVPRKHSVMSIGVCLVDDPSICWYRELKPQHGLSGYERDTIAVATPMLESVKRERPHPRYDPTSMAFNGSYVLRALRTYGVGPLQATSELYDWVIRTSEGRKIILCAAPSGFESGFMMPLFALTGVSYPFKHKSEDIASMYRGVTCREDAKLEELGLRPNGNLPHHALLDTQIQAREFSKVRLLMHERLSAQQKLTAMYHVRSVL